MAASQPAGADDEFAGTSQGGEAAEADGLIAEGVQPRTRAAQQSRRAFMIRAYRIPERLPSRSERAPREMIWIAHSGVAMIHLYLVRHAVAVEGSASSPDELRPLTTKGRKRFHKIARALGRRGEKLDAILASPLVRAVQTAEILAGEVRNREVALLAELAPGQPVEALLRAIAKRHGSQGAVALVGHEPQLSSVVTALVHLSSAQSSHLEFKSGTVVRIDVSDLPAAKSSLPRWWLKPRTGARKKGLPIYEPAPKPAPSPRKAKPAAKPTAARKTKPAVKAKAAKPRPAAKPKPAARPPLAAKARPASIPPPAPFVPQKFMGSPRPSTPPPPAVPAPASPVLEPPAITPSPAVEAKPKEP